MDDLATVTERLEDDIADGLFTKGAQVCISVDGEVRYDREFGEDGLGRPMGPETVFRVYCTAKPVTAMAIAKLVEDGALSLDEPLEDRLPAMAALQGGTNLRHVMSHTAGLHRTMGVTVEITPPDQRQAMLERQRRPSGWHVGTDAGYAEHHGWHVLGRLIEDISGQPLRQYLHDEVLAPLGMHDTWFGMDGDEFERHLDRIGVNVDMRSFRPYPMLFERTERVVRETNPSYGGYTNARDLDTFYSSTLRVLAGEQVAGLPGPDTMARFCSTERPPTYDQVLARECAYGLGFMTELAGHLFGAECSPRSFGHSGNVGSSFAFADPDHGLSVAVIFNGIVDHESAFLRRPSLMRAIYRDLGLDGDPEPAVAEPEPAARGGRVRRRRG